MRRSVVALACAAALAASACSGDDSSANVSGAPPTTAAPTTAAPTTAVAPARATLVDRPCEGAPWLPPTKCYFLEVPERRDVADAKRIRLWVDVVTPDGVIAGTLPLVWLTGGPGDAASPILDHRLTLVGNARPLVFVDQRGTGRSEPRLDCKEQDELTTDGTQHWADRVAEAQAAVKACRERLVADGVDLSGYNTAEDAADIVDLRKALGYDKWLLYGVSYGGRLAQQVLEIDGPATAGVVLDSSIPSAPLGPASLVERAKDAVVRLSAACAAQPTCSANTPDLQSTLDAAVSRMDVNPYTTSVLNPDGTKLVVTGQEVLSAAFNAQYRGDLIPVLPGAAKSIADGETGIIDGLAAQLNQDNGEASALNGVSTCADDGSDLNDADRAVLADPGEYGSLLIGWAYPRCSVWDVPPVPGGPLREPVSDVPVLLMEGGLDPVAPPRFADIIKAGLSHATVVIIPAGGHGNAFNGECATSISLAFLDNPQAPVDTSCVASLPQPLAP